MTLILTALPGMPYVRPGDDLVELVLQALERANLNLMDGDILVLAQKIVSKAENRLVNLSTIQPSSRAEIIATQIEKDPRLVELILSESSEILRIRPGTIVVEHKLGFVCANAGIDHSNVAGEGGLEGEWVLLLPENPDKSASTIRSTLEVKFGVRIGVMIIDSHGRAWRQGTVGSAIGLSGLPGLLDLRGQPDLFGYTLRVTTVGVSDELAAAASLLMGQAAEGTPAVHVRGFPYALVEGSLKELLRPKEMDLFR